MDGYHAKGPASAAAASMAGAERGAATSQTDVYFSADVETDGPIPGPYSMLSFAIVRAGEFDGESFEPPADFSRSFRAEMRPISQEFDAEAMKVNGIDRARLVTSGEDPVEVMTRAAAWIREQSRGGSPVLVAYPLSFDWTWLYWYFVRFARGGSPFNHSRCFDIKTAYAVKARQPIAGSGRKSLPPELVPSHPHTHDPLDDAIEQAEIFVKLFDWQRGR